MIFLENFEIYLVQQQSQEQKNGPAISYYTD